MPKETYTLFKKYFQEALDLDVSKPLRTLLVRLYYENGQQVLSIIPDVFLCIFYVYQIVIPHHVYKLFHDRILYLPTKLCNSISKEANKIKMAA